MDYISLSRIFEIAVLFRSTGLIKRTMVLSIYLFSCIFKTGWKGWSLLIGSWANMRFSPLKAQSAAWAQTFHSRQGWFCCLNPVVSSLSASFRVHDLVWCIENEIYWTRSWCPRSWHSDWKDSLASFPGLWDVSPGIQHHDPTSWDPRSLFPPQRGVWKPAPLQVRQHKVKPQAEDSELPKNTASPHYSLGE